MTHLCHVSCHPVNFQTELETLIRARYPILYIISSEEMRVQNIVVEIAAKRQKKVFEWTYSTGIVPAGTSIQSQKNRNAATKDPLAALDQVIEQVEPAIFLFKDFHPFLTKNNFAVIRKLKDIALHLKNSFKTIVLISPVMEIPAELDKEITVINFPLPTKEDLSELLDKIIDDVRGSKQVQIDLDDEGRERLLQAALGLDAGRGGERLRQDHRQERAAERRRRQRGLRREAADHPQERAAGVLRRRRGLRQRRRPGRAQGLAEQARAWRSRERRARSACRRRRASCCWACRAAARACAPRRSPACGNCRCCASTWAACSAAWSARRRKMSAGPSPSPSPSRRRSSGWTRSTRRLPAPKAPASTDGGTTARVFGTFLTWLSEKTAPVFVVATANDISQLPPELLRKGRLDEIFFVDLPAMRSGPRSSAFTWPSADASPEDFDLPALVAASQDFSGAEIEEAIISALYDAFYAKQELATTHVFTALSQTVPLAETMAEKITAQRNWANGRARNASVPLPT